MKYFRMSYEEVVSKRSYKNIVLLNASIPSYRSKEDKEGGKRKPTRHGNRPMHANEYFSQFL